MPRTNMKPSPLQEAALRALLREYALIVQHGIIGPWYIGSMNVNRNTFGALQDRRWIEQVEVEYGPEREIPPSAVAGRRESMTYRPVKRVTYRITDAGRAVVGESVVTPTGRGTKE